MRLYLVRHGEAKPAGEDPERHLSDAGVQEAERVAAFLKPLGLRVGVLWHSGKARAAQTAEILAPALTADEGIVRRDGLAPNDPVGPVADAVSAWTDDVMIVGHLPFLGMLAALLLAGDEDADLVAFQCGAVVCLEGSGRSRFRLRWLVTPELVP